MHHGKIILSFLFLVHLVPVITGECASPPLVIDSLVSFECSVLSDDLNIQSLTQAFFPANRRQALVVEVHYYVNRTLHPLALSAEETQPADYTFMWFGSPVLGFIEPRMISGLSLNTLSLTHNFNFAHLLVAPLASDDEDWIRGMLTNGTAWLKSYAELRLSGGIQGVSRGFSAYKPDPKSDDYFLYFASGSDRVAEAYVVLLGASLVFVVIIMSILIPNAIHKHFHILHKWSLRQKTPEQRFKFRNLFWASVMVLILGDLVMHGYVAYHILTFGLKWKTSYSFIYPMFIAAIFVIHVLSVATAVKIGRHFYLKNILVNLPRSLYVFFLRCCSGTDEGKVQRVIFAIWHGLAVWGAMTVGSFSSIFLVGIVMALFVDPVQVIVTLAIYINVCLCAVIAFASVFETTDKISGKGKTPKRRCVAYLKFVFECILFVITLLFIAMFGYTYATIVFFAGGSYSELFSSFGELFPVLLFSAITWVLRKEINKYRTSETKTKPETETEGGEPREMDVYRVKDEAELQDAEPNHTDVYRARNEPVTEIELNGAKEMNRSGRTKHVPETSEPPKGVTTTLEEV